MKKKIFNIIEYTEIDAGRIDKFLQSQLKELSRTKIQNLIKQGHVKLNNANIYETSKKNKKRR